MPPLAYHPWMKRAALPADASSVTIDLAAWPAREALPALRVPVLAVGAASHEQAAQADALVPDEAGLARLTAQIDRHPRAAAVLVQLLRATEGVAPERALVLESLAYAALQAGGEHAAWLAAQAPAPARPEGALRMARDGGTLSLVLDRPAALNAIDRAMRDALYDAFTLATLDDGITAIRLAGAGRCFSTGAELAEFGTTRDPVTAHAIRMRTLPALALPRGKRLAVHVHGACIGAGLELAAFAHRLTAAPDAWFQLPELGMGIIPGFGGCVSIPRRIGRQRAAALMLSGRRFGARAALRLGLVDAIVSDGAADEGEPDIAG